MVADAAEHVGEPGTGSVSFKRVVTISEYVAAVRSPPRLEPANSQAFRPRATPRRARSAELLLKQIRPSFRKRVKRSRRLSM
jgi:hypothetical protein